MSKHVTGRSIVTVEWVSIPESATTTITRHAVRADEPRAVALCGSFLAEVHRGRPWESEGEDVCQECAERVAWAHASPRHTFRSRSRP
jgi:hypothetical protein